MKRAMRRTGAPPRETTNPTMRYLVPRYRWPAAWEALSEHRCAFVTGLGQPSPAPELGAAAPIEVLVAQRGAVILERLGARLVGGGPDPWVARMREYEKRRAEAAEALARANAPAADAFEAAFRREAERVRARLAAEDEP